MGDGTDWKRKWTLIFIICLVDFSAWRVLLYLRHYPQEAALKGVPEQLVGFIFGMYELVIFIASPIFGIVVDRIGHKFLFASSVFVSGICSILFGLLEFCPPGGAYIALCLSTRIIEALGASAFALACVTLSTSEFPEKVTFIVGIIETCSGVGLMAGPLIGGAFYQCPMADFTQLMFTGSLRWLHIYHVI